MSDTPRTDAISTPPSTKYSTLVVFTRQLERELSKAQERCSEWADIAGKHGAEVDTLRRAITELQQRLRERTATDGIVEGVEALIKQRDELLQAVKDAAEATHPYATRLSPEEVPVRFDRIHRDLSRAFTKVTGKEVLQ